MSASPLASADDDSSGAVTGAGFGPTLGVGGPESYSGGSTSNSFCGDPWTVSGGSTANVCAGASLGVGGASSYTGGSTANNSFGTATLGVGGVESYTGQGTSGLAENGTNATTRTVNFGPG
ncbi:hypothetical protein ORI20_17510 [Mycobacterium sp. CVI_P3]|uniref:PPE family protein n=1 Tax=Mycobacterium pinniadriaticum TaxID=2994102 RepID=A0ABT3SHY1_9MYCO|nr:hypothetical protein [Mycobacterium pinniadriaticum]MCX2932076.1 hypothetical protein [Mycobacterium pinniadriaticum]MCX2938500.1 hypothetical protein [Mycobacterium pinniadriaticum]